MLTRSQLHPYQLKAIEHIKTHPRSMLWLDIGLGKTTSTLTALSDLIQTGQVYGVLILAPLRVCQTVWEQEAHKWEHTQYLDFSLIHGSPDHRKRALRKRRLFYLLNYEGLPDAHVQFHNAYLARGKPLPFNCVVFDESTLVKSARVRQGGTRTTALRKLLKYIPYRIGLTGTPAPNGLLDLFGQFLVLDDGKRLGTAYTHYRSSYFTGDFNGWNYYPTELGKSIIHQRISDITLQMSAKDYLNLPPVTFNTITVDLPPTVQKQYEILEKEMFLLLDSGASLKAPNAAALTNKCLQMAAGAVYPVPLDPHWEFIHDVKLEALGDIVEELSGNPLLIGYQFKSDAQRIQAWADKKNIECPIVNSKVPVKEMKVIVNRFNAGQIPMLVGHGKSMGHGLNLQQTAHHIAWFGLPWSSELYDQVNGRLARQGQKNRVVVHQLVTAKTMDFAVLRAQHNKAQTQSDLKQAINEYRRMKNA